jgi:cysteinyl-tRNA synthetase
MSKSTGHLVDLGEAIERFGGLAVRLLYLRAHYRSPLEFSETLVQDAQSSLQRIERLLERAERAPGAGADEEILDRFRAAMDEDFGTPDALGVLFDAVREANRLLDAGAESPALVAAVHEMVDVLGLRPAATDLSGLTEPAAALASELGVDASGPVTEVLDRLVEQRSKARAARDFATSDQIRDRLAEIGVAIEDGADGSRWVRR